MKKLRIMWLHSHLTLPSGGTKYVLQGIQELSKNHSVDLFVQKASLEYEEIFKKSGVNITILSNRSTGDLTFWLNFSKQIKKETQYLKNLAQNYDLVVSSMFPMNVIASNIHLPHLQSCFQPFAFFWDPIMISKLSYFERLFIKFIKFRFGKLDLEATKKSDRISTVISDIQDWIKQVYERDSFVAHAGVDVNFFKKTDNAKLREKYSGKKIILHSTDWTPLKRTKWLIDQFIKNFSDSVEVQLLILEVKTKGTEKNEVLSKLRERKISNVELCGHVPEEMLPAYYSLANVTVYCGIGEGAGAASYIVLESLSCETPVIRTNLTHDEVEDEKTGFLFEPSDITVFEENIKRILDNPDLATEFGKSGRDFEYEKLVYCINNIIYIII